MLDFNITVTVPGAKEILAAIADLKADLAAFKETSMSAFDDLQASQAANATATESLITLTNTIKDQLDALAANGGATADQLNALKAQVDTETANIQAALARDTPTAP